LPHKSDDLNQAAASMMASLKRTLVLLYRRHFEHYVLDVTVLRAEAALERAGLARRRPVQPPAIGFLDLTGYTKLTEERGDQARGRAGRLAGRDRPRARPPLPHAPAALFADKCAAGLAVVGRRRQPRPPTLRAQRLRDSRDRGEARAFSPTALSRPASPACSSP
jgi:hypothetical protein